MLVYSNNGLSFRSVPDDYEVAQGEILYSDYPTDEQLNQDFLGRAAAQAEITKAILLVQINKEVNDYIYSKYDSGTQASFMALYVAPNASQQLKTAIESVWTWSKTVLLHYYTAKANIQAGQAHTWNLSQFDATDPGVSLAGLLQ